MREKFLAGLFIVLAIVLVLALLIVTNVSGYYHTMGELHDTLGEIGRAVWTGIQILFWVGLAFALGCLVLWWRREHNVIRPDKHGPAQAVKHGREVIAVPQPVLVNTVSVGDEMKRALDMLSQMQRVAKQMGTVIAEERTIDADPTKQIAAPLPLPEKVLYEEVQHSVPQGHALLGVDGRGVKTCDFGKILTCLILGGSGTGKSNTIAIKVEEALKDGWRLIIVDPHKRKPDSLYNRIKEYSYAFLKLEGPEFDELEEPLMDGVAQTDEQIKATFIWFLREFKRRLDEGVRPDDPSILIICDEVGNIAEIDDDTIPKMLKRIARICGNESRGFGMAGWFMNQNATGIAWLRKVVMTVIVHKINMMSERRVACNENEALARRMDAWPKHGRVYVYGLSFEEVYELQMPLKTQAHIIDATPHLFHRHIDPLIPNVQSVVRSTMQSSIPSINQAVNYEVQPPLETMERTERNFPFSISKLKKIRELIAEEKSQQDIVCEVWEVQPSTRAFHRAVEEYRKMLAYLASVAAAQQLGEE